MPAHPLRSRLLPLLFLASWLVPTLARAEPFWYKASITSATTTKLDDTDLAVIEAVARDRDARQWFPQKNRQWLVIQAEGIPGKIKAGLFGSAVLMRDPATSQSVINFRERNTFSFRLPRRVKRGNLTVIGSVEYEQLYKEKRIEKEFAAIHEIVIMWLPGYDQSKSEAVVYAYVTSDDSMGLSGQGEYIRLKRQGREWKVVERHIEWNT